MAMAICGARKRGMESFILCSWVAVGMGCGNADAGAGFIRSHRASSCSRRTRRSLYPLYNVVRSCFFLTMPTNGLRVQFHAYRRVTLAPAMGAVQNFSLRNPNLVLARNLECLSTGMLHFFRRAANLRMLQNLSLYTPWNVERFSYRWHLLWRWKVSGKKKERNKRLWWRCGGTIIFHSPSTFPSNILYCKSRVARSRPSKTLRVCSEPQSRLGWTGIVAFD
ncbi:hypothetical protein K458DRAFT_143814 [Lentithecium fluviatile CBS 122367]|uniref:Uncharacterized protein n=1 Tax=Lentithecium fluviatile CBS 122367 TaxID=1168545 RepID=A0A6G1IJA7_9PLEO|nr:hypothetical protein K458DRAFT_143814 [Lentithecium fluviatile CBS 122367]